MRRKNTFELTLVTGLTLCLAFYAEETVHFLHYGRSGIPASDTDQIPAFCEPVAGMSHSDFECLIDGYGRARYRHLNHQYQFIDRIE